MFYKDRIQHLEFKDGCFDTFRTEQSQRYWELRRDIDAIAKHLGVKFEDINKRVLVKTDTPQSEP